GGLFCREARPTKSVVEMVAPGRAMLALALAVAVTPGPARRHEAFSRRQAQAGAAPYTKGEPVTAEAIR
ncbi:MAG: hypothetical protein ACPIOQ_40690, partial [Promethearchaeia archaeon]